MYNCPNLTSLSGWDLLVAWYGCVPGQPPIARQVVEHGLFVKNCKVEVYLVDFKLSQTDDVDNYVTKSFSKAATIEGWLMVMNRFRIFMMKRVVIENIHYFVFKGVFYVYSLE